MHLGTRSLVLTVDGVSRTADVSDCRIVSERLPEPLGLYGTSNRGYRLVAVAAQDMSEESLWSLVWDHEGESAEVDIRPAGGTVRSADQPSFVGTVTITESDGDLLGGEANPSQGGRFTFQIDWPFDDKPTRLDDESTP